MTQRLTRHLLLYPRRMGRALDRLVIDFPKQMVAGSTEICRAGNNQNHSKLSAARRNFRAKAPGSHTPGRPSSRSPRQASRARSTCFATSSRKLRGSTVTHCPSALALQYNMAAEERPCTWQVGGGDGASPCPPCHNAPSPSRVPCLQVFQHLPLAMPVSGVAGLMEVATAPAAFSFSVFQRLPFDIR